MGKLKTGLGEIKLHWKTPPEGYQLSYKEFASYAVGAGSVNLMSVLVQWTTLAMNIPMMITYFKVSTGMIFVFGLAASLVGLVRAPILSMIIDNSNSPKGKFKPFLFWSVLASSICFGLIPFIPHAWTENILYSFSIPSINIFNVAASTVDLSLGVVVMFIMLQVGTFFFTLLTQAMAGIEQTITTVAQERAYIGAYKGFITSLPSSVVNVVMPLLAGMFFASGTTTGMNNIKLYRIVFPLCAVGAFICVLFAIYGTKERAVVNKQYVNRVRFIEGAKELSRNKYFWILTILGIAVGIRSLANIYFWTCTYAIGGKAGDTAIAVCNVVLGNAFIPGMAFGPTLIKKFGKRNVLLVSNILFAVMVLLQFALIRNPYLTITGIFFQNLCSGVGFISVVMVSDVLDFQQWKTGKRLEGFWQNYTAFIVTIIGVFIGILTPLALSFAGIGFGDNINTALKDPVLMQGAFRSITMLAFIGSIVAMVPMFFYDLTENKHANYVRVLKIRAAADNFTAGCLQDEDVANIKSITYYAAESGDEFVKEELKKYDCLNEIPARM